MLGVPAALSLSALCEPVDASCAQFGVAGHPPRPADDGHCTFQPAATCYVFLSAWRTPVQQRAPCASRTAAQAYIASLHSCHIFQLLCVSWSLGVQEELADYINGTNPNVQFTSIQMLAILEEVHATCQVAHVICKMRVCYR